MLHADLGRDLTVLAFLEPYLPVSSPYLPPYLQRIFTVSSPYLQLKKGDVLNVFDRYSPPPRLDSITKRGEAGRDFVKRAHTLKS
eukprot:5710913-Prymnesium_polylepis.1